MDAKEIRWKDLDMIRLVHDRNEYRALVKTVINLKVP
jgi:hypothetical protein